MKFKIPDEHKKASGIYIIRSTVTDDTYIGRTQDFKFRFKIYQQEIKRNSYTSPKLKAYILKHGGDSLNFELYALCECRNTLKAQEVEAIRSLKPSLNSKVYKHPTTQEILNT